MNAREDDPWAGVASPDDAHQPLVLVVDDEPRSLDAIRRTLEEDFRVITAGSADQARHQPKAPSVSTASNACRMAHSTPCARWPRAWPATTCR